MFLPEEFHGQRSLVGYGPWGHKSWTWLTNTHTHTANTEENWLAVLFYTLLKSQNQISWEHGGNLPLTVWLESREIGQNSQTAERSLFCASPKGPPRAASLAPITSGGRDEQQLGLLEAETRAHWPRPVLLALIGGPLPTAQGWGGRRLIQIQLPPPFGERLTYLPLSTGPSGHSESSLLPLTSTEWPVS